MKRQDKVKVLTSCKSILDVLKPQLESLQARGEKIAALEKKRRFHPDLDAKKACMAKESRDIIAIINEVQSIYKTVEIEQPND